MHLRPIHLVMMLLTVSTIGSTGYLLLKTSALSKLNYELKSQLYTAQNKINDLDNKANNLRTQQEEQAVQEQNKTIQLDNKVRCLELIKVTPDTGPSEYIGKDIVSYYKYSVEKLNSVKANPTRPDDPEETAAEKKFWQGNVDKAKPLYDVYISRCAPTE